MGSPSRSKQGRSGAGPGIFNVGTRYHAGSGAGLAAVGPVVTWQALVMTAPGETRRTFSISPRRSAACASSWARVAHSATSSPWARSSSASALRAAADQVWLEVLGHRSRLHSLRHWIATCWALRYCVPLPVIQGWLGHRSIKTTERYVHPEDWQPEELLEHHEAGNHHESTTIPKWMPGRENPANP